MVAQTRHKRRRPATTANPTRRRAGGRSRTETVPATELQRIYALHQLWLGSQGKEGVRADLSGRNLREWTFVDVDWRHANFRKADLRNANLSGADFLGADLRSADLRGANLEGTVFTESDLRGVLVSPKQLEVAAGVATADMDENLELEVYIQSGDTAKVRAAQVLNFRPSLSHPGRGYAVRLEGGSPYHADSFEKKGQAMAAASALWPQGQLYMLEKPGTKARRQVAGTPAIDNKSRRFLLRAENGTFGYFEGGQEAQEWGDKNLPPGTTFSLYRYKYGGIDSKVGDYLKIPDEEVGGSSVTVTIDRDPQGMPKNRYTYIVQAFEYYTDKVVDVVGGIPSKKEAKKVAKDMKSRLKEIGYKDINVLESNPSKQDLHDHGPPDEVVEAAFLAQQWHGGQASALYRLSGGAWEHLDAEDYLEAAQEFREILDNDSVHDLIDEDRWELEAAATALDRFGEAMALVEE